MKTYLGRSIRYGIKLLILIGLLIAVMIMTKTSNIDTKNMFAELFLSYRGVILITTLVLLVATYPLFGFVKRDVRGSITIDRDTIMNTMALNGYELTDERDGVMVFRAKSFIKRMLRQWDDQVWVSGDERFITLEGNRKEVVKTQYRLESFIR